MNNKNKSPYNAKGQRHGLYEYYDNYGELYYNCVLINGKENGFECYYYYGEIIYKNYHL